MTGFCRHSVRGSITVIPVVLILLSFGLSHGQAGEAERIVLSERVGDEIDQSERETYGLFPGVEGFQSAEVFRLSAGQYVFKILYLDSVTKETRSRLIYETEERVGQIRERIDQFVPEDTVVKVSLPKEKEQETPPVPHEQAVPSEDSSERQDGFADGEAAGSRKSRVSWCLAGAGPGFFFAPSVFWLWLSIAWPAGPEWITLFGAGFGLDAYLGTVVYKKADRLPGELPLIIPAGSMDYQSGFVEGYCKATTSVRRRHALYGCLGGGFIGLIVTLVFMFSLSGPG